MKYLGPIGLIAAVALAVSAGVGTASAAVTLCKTAPNKSSICEGGTYPSGTSFEATSTNAKFTVSGSPTVTSISCTHSVMQWHNTATSGSPLPIEVTDTTFTGCTSDVGPCTINTTKGYLGSISHTSNGNGTMTITGSAVTTVICGELFRCSWKLVKAGRTLTFTGGNPYVLSSTEQEFEKGGEAEFGCGTGAKFDGTYTAVGVNKAVWVATT